MTLFPELPLLKREVVGLLRTRRAFRLLVLSVAVSGLVPLIGWTGWRSGGAEVNAGIFCVTMIVQLTLALLIIPAFTAGAISAEREGQTYELLYSTLLSPAAIVLAKAAAASGYVIILLAASAPAVSLLYLQGGIAFDTILASYAITFAAVIASGLICLSVSMRSQRTAAAAARGIVWVVFWNGGLLLLIGLALSLLENASRSLYPGSTRWLMNWFMALSPYCGIVLESLGSPFGLVAGGGFLSLGPWQLNVLYAMLLAATHLLHLLLRVRTPDVPRSGRRERRLAAVGVRPRPPRRTLFHRLVLELGESGVPLLANPLFLKEARAEFFARAWFRRGLFWATLLVLIGLSLLGDEPPERLGPPVVVALALAVLLLPAVIAPSIAREREQGNFDLLRGTALSMREILQAKYMAGLFGCFGLAAAIGWTMLLAPLLPTRPFSSAVTTPWIWLAAAVVLPLTGLFTAAVSIFAAVAARRTVAALVGAYGALLALFVVVPVLCALAGRPGGMPDYFWGINPFIGFTVAVDDKDGLACLFLFGVLYAAGTAGVWFAALRLFQQRHARDV